MIEGKTRGKFGKGNSVGNVGYFFGAELGSSFSDLTLLLPPLPPPAVWFSTTGEKHFRDQRGQGEAPLEKKVSNRCFSMHALTEASNFNPNKSDFMRKERTGKDWLVA